MRKFYFLLAAVCLSVSGFSQDDTTEVTIDRDTIRVGNMIIIKKDPHGKRKKSHDIEIKHKKFHNPNVKTTWAIVDIGFNNFQDKTNYASAEAQRFAPGGNAEWFNLRNGKSINVNIWFFMQRLNAVKHVLNVIYGLGLELNNYRYQENIRYTESNTIVYVEPAVNYSKNKLAADYLTVPLMLNLNFTPGREGAKSFGISAGVSGGYLYSSRQKIKSAEHGKQKFWDDFNLRPFKISYIAEMQLGPVKVYGSMANKSMFKNGLDQTPYNVGIRLGAW